MSVFLICSETHAGAFESKTHPGVFLREVAQGYVIATWERNGYDDSDFVARVWNPETMTVDDIVYASTSWWSYAAYAEVDATAYVLQCYEHWSQARTEATRKLQEEQYAKAITVGKTVRISLRAGKNREYHGQTALVTWVGQDKYKPGAYRAGLKIEGREEPLYLSFNNLEVIQTTT